jgi:flagellin-like protein
MVQKLMSEEKGVSPVIGVMLMIVVTVILAAAVSAYTSNMGDSKQVAPQVSLTAGASIHDGYILLSHLGGSTIDRRAIEVVIESGYPSSTGYVDITDVEFTGSPDFLNAGYEAKIYFINSTEDADRGLNLDLDDDEILFEGAEISQKVELGEPFGLTIIDTNSGNTIYSRKITLQP